MTEMRKRSCKMCPRVDLQRDMIKIAVHRLRVLEKWYPELTSPNDYVHRECLTVLGLHPFPKKSVDLGRIIGAKVTARIAELVAQHPDVRGPRQLIECVHNRMRDEFRVPTEEGHKQMRYMISHWILCHHTAHAGGGVALGDDVTAEDVDALVPIEEIDTSLRLSDHWVRVVEPQRAEAGNQRTLMDLDPVEAIHLSDAQVERIERLAKVFSGVSVARRGETEARKAETEARTLEQRTGHHRTSADGPLAPGNRAEHGAGDTADRTEAGRAAGAHRHREAAATRGAHRPRRGHVRHAGEPEPRDAASVRRPRR